MKKLIITTVAAILLMGTAAAADNVRVAVLSNIPMALQLQVANQELQLQDTGWKQTSRGYETMVMFPRRLTKYNRARLIRADKLGYSDWGRKEMQYLRRNNVTQSDPVCVGGKAWCATRGF